MVTIIRPHMQTTAMMPIRYARVQVLARGCVAHCGALLLFTLLTLASAPTLALHPSSAVTPDLIDPVHHIWSVASLLHMTLAWRDGLWSFFDGNIFYPTPHAASFADTFVGLLPILLPLTLLTQDPTVLANMLAILSFVLSAYQAMQQNHGLFPGIVPLILVVIALRAKRGRVWGIFALCCGVLALGPALMIRGRILPFPLPYAILSDLVPHFALFRDPTRALAGLYLGMAALSAWGTREVIAHARARTTRRLGVGAIIVGLVALELWTVLPVARLAPIPQGEYWLARQPHIHAIVELPIANATPLDWQRQTEIMRDSTVHWKPMVDGSESLDPVGMARRRAVLDTYPLCAAYLCLVVAIALLSLRFVEQPARRTIDSLQNKTPSYAATGNTVWH